MQATQEGLSGFTLASLGVLFVALWCLTSLFMSWQSGWRLLSKRFPAQSEFLAEMKKAGFPFDICFRFWTDYTNLTWVAAEKELLHLSVVFPFRIGHPPLSIPWNEIEVSRTKILWRSYLVLTLGSEERIPMRVSESAARKLEILERIPASVSDPQTPSEVPERIATQPPPLQ